MRDGINLTRAGHPTVVIVQSNFERAARAQAKVLGMSDLRMYVYPGYDSSIPAAVEEAKAVQAAVDCENLLLVAS